MRLKNKLNIVILLLLIIVGNVWAQEPKKLDSKDYWNQNLPLVSYRLPPPPIDFKPVLEDLDGDGDPDIIRTLTIGNTPVLWIDDDDDMKTGDLEGDTDSDCLLIDVNKDGRFCDSGDIAIDWIDTNNDGEPDMQVFVENSNDDPPKKGNSGHYMWVIDNDNDNIFNYIDWNTFKLRAWLHEGSSNFLEDYVGKSTFLKAHNTTYYMNDIRLNWENPFLFFDPDNDGLTEIAFRALDRPASREKSYTEGKISYVGISYDLDNDNSTGNEFDFDMSLRFKGPGFDYMDQVHAFNNPRVEETDTLFRDPRWRQVNELIYPGFETAFDLTFNKGEWDNIFFVYDEDDDCERWERVDFYEPRNLFKVGGRKPNDPNKENGGGLDHNQQTDAIGDRGEWDLDNSGNANLYISNFDGRLHLFGAEWGAWRIDQLAFSYQGWGGMYDNYQPKWERLQKEDIPFSTFKYEDTDNNGFLDKISMDIDGDTLFEKIVFLKELGIDDRCETIDPSKMTYEDFHKLHTTMSEGIWNKAQSALKVADKFGLNTKWYAFMKSPKSEHQKYNYGYWLQFYIYMDLCDLIKRGNTDFAIETIDKAYFSGAWETILN